ncbi:hypothetical protein U9M48_042912 [Paspalum notatum var. saurae]|uniref:Uncharacterized protein n=1 Tax=Paspalum notatum var. saurae TaxID=547442 RepID=A0AAQ3UWA9_PASNO
MRKQKEGAAMAAPLPHGCPLSSLHSPHHRNMKTECSYHKEDDPLLRSSIHALKDAMEVASLLLPLLSMGVETMESTPDDPRRRGKAAALWDRLFALRINVCEQQQKYFLRKARCDNVAAQPPS